MFDPQRFVQLGWQDALRWHSKPQVAEQAAHQNARISGRFW